MSQQLQDLIEKIKNEGVAEAKNLSRGIEDSARKKADELVRQAQSEAQNIVSQAQAERQKMTEATHIALKQASRDMILNLRKEIESTLHKIIAKDVKSALGPENLVDIIRQVIVGYLKDPADPKMQEIKIILNDKDLKMIKDGFIAELKDKIKQPITLKAVDGVGAGFTISFDGGKSFFDFSDVSLAEYLSSYVNAQVAVLLKEAAAA